MREATLPTHTHWELRVLADVPGVALAPQSVAHDLPAGVVALALSESRKLLETDVVWRTDDSAPTLAAFLEVARRVFDRRPEAAAHASLG